MNSLWSLATVLGPILLIAAIVYAWYRNRAASRDNLERAERGAAQLREKIHDDPKYEEA